MKSFIKLPRRLVQKAVDELLLAWEPNETTDALKAALAEKPSVAVVNATIRISRKPKYFRREEQ